MINKLPAFVPSKKDFRVEYPELGEIEEFQELTDYELKFCWFYGAESSPYAGMSPVERCRNAAESAYPQKERYGKDYKDLYEGNFNGIIEAAIKRMEAFDVKMRNEASEIISEIFDNYKEMVKVTKDMLSIMDFQEKKNYIDLASKVSEVLPRILEQKERNFGVSKKKVKKLEENLNLMDSIVSSNS